MIENGVMLQYFHWHIPSDGRLWAELVERAQEIAGRSITGVWIPPAYKGADGANDVGYGVYDLFDLGEFEQKGSTRTKYGSKAELLHAVQALRERNIRVYADIVFNQRCGRPNATFKDCTGHDHEAITTDDNGAAEFRCPAGSLSVWLQA